MLLQPHAEALQLHQNAQRVEADGLSNGEFAIHLGKTLFASERLPLIDTVRARGWHIIATANPRLGIIPLPRAILCPRALPLGKERQGKCGGGDQGCNFHVHRRIRISPLGSLRMNFSGASTDGVMRSSSMRPVILPSPVPIESIVPFEGSARMPPA